MVYYVDWFVDVDRVKTIDDTFVFICGINAFVLKPETKYWNIIKKNTPDIFWTRIESWASAGVPDCYGCKDGVMFWVELKITKDKKIKLSPFQKVWHFNHARQGGRSFIMAHYLGDRLSCIFPSSIAVGPSALSVDPAKLTTSLPGNAASWHRAQEFLRDSPLPPLPKDSAVIS